MSLVDRLDERTENGDDLSLSDYSLMYESSAELREQAQIIKELTDKLREAGR